MDWAPLERFASRHYGLLTIDRAAEFGVTKGAWYWALERGRLREVHPRVAKFPGADDTPEQRILAAVSACGDFAMASHRSGGHVWVPDVPPPVVDVTVPRNIRAPSMSGVVVHRPRDLDDLRQTTWRGIPTANPLRVLLDYGAVEPEGVRPLLERMVVAGFVTPGAVRATLARHAKPGRSGATALRAALDDWAMNEKPPDSVLEERVNALVREFGLPPVTFHPIVIGYEPDFIVDNSMIIIECDGWATHGLQRATFESDKERDLEFIAAGYAVVRVTWRMIRRQPALAARRIRAVIARVAPHLLSQPSLGTVSR